ncbi:hypothetical protein C8J57DRAFT_1585028 [Mycena rebaudengoi]|nr:hypothetical protein C8J57DRAFT_1585028 [Mycena rebaudengoi]
MLCLPKACERSEYYEPRSEDAPLLLMKVCGRWSDIALSTPTLWSTIHAHFPRARGFENLFDSWLARAHPRPLSISLHGDIESVLGVVCSRAHQVQALELWIDHDGLLPEASFPSLKTLTVVNTAEISNFTAIGFMRLLQSAPDLVECSLDNMDTGLNVPSLTLPSLQYLCVGPRGTLIRGRPYSAAITSPALQTLIISNFDLNTEDVASFLARSESPPIQSVTLFYLGLEAPSALAKLFSLTPTVTEVKLLCVERGDEPACTTLFNLLSHHGFLPQLRDLEIKVISDWSRSWVDTIYSSLSARPVQIESIRIVVPCWPEPQLLAPLRQLVAERGMEFYFGTGNESYLVI